MNKIFKVIWSKTKGCYVVVSEIAKNQSKSGKRRARDLALAAIVGVGVVTSNGVSAAPVDDTSNAWVQLNQNVSNMQNQILTLNNWKDSVTQNGGISGGTGPDLSDYATVDYVDKSIAALTAKDGAITAAQAAATTADGKAVAAQTTANEAKTAAATADGKAVAAQNKANQNADAITALQNNKADKTALAEVKATADAAATKTELQAEVTRAKGAEAQALADAKTYTDGKLGAAAGGMYISATNTVAQNMTAIDTKLQDVQKITYNAEYKDTAEGSKIDAGATMISGPVVISGETQGHSTITINSETGRIKGLSNTDWVTDPTLDGSSVAATQGQLYDIASKGFQVTANNGTFNAPLASQISIVGDGTNITTSSAEGSRELKINLTNTPSFGEVNTSPKAGKQTRYNTTTKEWEEIDVTTTTKVDGSGVYIQPSGTTSGSANTVSLTASGLNNGRQQLKNIADGTDYTDAVTYKQLIAERIKIQGAGDAVVTFAPIVTEGTDIIEGTMYTITVNDRDTKPAGDGLTTTVSNGNVVSVRLAKAADGSDGSIIATEGANGGLTLNPVLTLDGGAQSLTFDAPAGHIDGLTNITWYRPLVEKQVPVIDPATGEQVLDENENPVFKTELIPEGYIPNRAATEGQIKDVVDKGWTLGADNASKTLALNKTANIIGGNNIQTTIAEADANGNLNLTVSTTQDVLFNTVNVKNLDPQTGLPIAGTNTVSIDSQYVYGLKNTSFFVNNPLNTVVKGNDTSATYLATGNLPENVATSNKAATEAQLFDVVTGLNAADRYITKASTETNSTGTTVTLTQNNANNIVFTIPPTTGGGGGTGSLVPHPDDDNHPLNKPSNNARGDGNEYNWYIQDGDTVYENTTLATMDSTREGAKSSVTAITGVIDGMADSTRDQVTSKITSMADATTGQVTYGHDYVIMDTAGNAIQLSDLASANVLETVHGVVLNHDGRIRTVEDGFKLKAGTETPHEGDVKPGETLEFTGNVTSTNANIKIDYEKSSETSNIDKIDISVVDDPTFASVEVGTAGGKKAIIDSNGVSFDGNYYIGPNGLDANGKVISRVAPGAITSTSLDAVNGSQLYPIKKAVEDGFTVNGYKINLIGEGTEGFTINAGKNIVVTTNGSATNIATSMTPEFTAVTVGDNSIEGSTPITINAANQGTIRNLKNTTWTVNKSVPYSGQAATEDQLAIVDAGLTNLGMNFVGDDGREIHKNLGNTLKIVGGARTKTEKDNIYVEYVENEGNPYFKVNLAKDVDLTTEGSIIVEDVKLDKTGLSMTNGANLGADQQVANYNESGMTVIRPKNDSRHDLAFTDEYISAGDNVITNVGSGLTLAPGQTTPNLNNAATVGDVMEMATEVTDGKNTTAVGAVKDPKTGKMTYKVDLNENVKLGASADRIVLNGSNGTATFGTGTNKVQINNGAEGTITAGKVTVNGAAGTVNGLTNKTWTPGGAIVSGQAATEDQLKAMESSLVAGGWGLTADGTGEAKQELGKTLKIKGDDNITTAVLSDKDGVEIKLNDRVILGDGNKAVTIDGVAGTISAGTGDLRVLVDGTKNQIQTGDVNIIGTKDSASIAVGNIKVDGKKGIEVISGLSNKTITWSATSPLTDAQKGIAATQGQLEAYANADTDYRIAEAEYTVDASGSVSMAVEDAKGIGEGYNVVINDIAKKSDLDAVANDYVKNVTVNGNSMTINQVVGGDAADPITFNNTDISVKPGSVAVTADGTVTLQQVDIDGNVVAGKDVVITGIASSADLDNASLSYTTNTDEAKSINLKTGVLTFVDGSNTEAKTNEDGSVTFDLAKDIDLGEDGSITIGDTNITGDTINVGGDEGTTITEEGMTVGDTTITGDTINIGGDEGTTITGDTITTTTVEATNVVINGSDLTIDKGSADVNGTEINRIKYDNYEVATLNDGMKYTGDRGDQLKMQLNENVNIKGGASENATLIEGNIGVVSDGDNTLSIQLNKDIDLGEDGSITIGDTNITGDTINVGGDEGTTITEEGMTVGDTTITGDTINIGGEEGTTITGDTITTTTVEATNVVINGTDLTIEEGSATVKGDVINRIKYDEEEVATLNDGLKFSADEGDDVAKKLNETVAITGDSNITTKTTADGVQVTLNKDIDLTDKGSITIGDTNITDSNATFGNTDSNKVVINGDEGKVSIGDQINLDGSKGQGNIGDILFNQDKTYTTSITGMSNTSWDVNKVQVDRVATEGQLKDVFDLAKAHNTVSTADPNNITVKETQNADGGTNYELNLGNKLNIGGPGADGAPGKDGSIGVQGATGETGVSLNGKDGSIGIDGKDGASATITVVGGEKGADGAPGVDGKNITRIEYQDATGTHDVATLDDGMKFTADDGKVIEKKLNETLAIVGDDNITTTVTDDGAIQVTLNKDIAVDSIDVADGTFKANEDGVSISVEDTNVVVTDGLIGMGVGDDTSMSMNDSNINMTVGDTSIDVDADGVTFNNGDSMTIINGDNIKAGDITIDGGEGTIGGLTNTTFDPDNYVSGQAATEDQLKQVHDLAKAHNTVTTADPNNITIKETENEDGGTNYELNLGDSLNIGGPKDGKDGVDGQIAVNGADGKDSVVINGKDGISIKGEDGSIGLNGKDGLSIKGADGKDGVNAYVDGDGAGHIGLNGKDGANADITVVKGDPGVKGEDGETIDRIVYGDHTVATLDDGMKYSGDVGDQLKMQLNENVNIIGGVDDEAALTDNNIGVVSNGRDTLTIKLNKELTGLEKVQVGDVVIDGKENTIQVGENTKIGDGTVETKEVTAENVIVKETIKVGDKTEITGDTVTTETVKTGDTTINNNGMTIKDGPTVNKDKVDVAGNKIENVAPGILSKDSMDAVNGSQLYQTNQTINKLGNRVNRVGARSAALAALHPMDFDPDDKLTFAAGYGNYKGENAAAIGAFYRPDEKVMFSLAGTVSNDDNMINAGVSFSLDRTPHQTNSKTAMARDILDLTAKVNLLLQENDRMKNALREATKNGGRVSIEFPDLPKDHWAYMYVQELAELGYLIGYPDGLYKGDRTLTRYEFATALYRALMNGAPVDDKMGRGMDEFKNELDNVAKAARFRVDRIAGQDDDRNKIERVRTNHEGDESIPDYRDVYGSKIAPPAKK